MAELPATKTTIALEDLRAALDDAWDAKFGAAAPPTNAIEVLMSQSALETGAWSACRAFNLGNIKNPLRAEGYCYFTTRERLLSATAHKMAAQSTPAAPCTIVPGSDDGKHAYVVVEPKHIACCFRAFSTLGEGAAWYLDFLAAHETTAWPAVMAGDVIAFAHALKQHGYYTAPENEYVSGCARFLDMYGVPQFADMSAITAALRELGYATVSDFQCRVIRDYIDADMFASAADLEAATGFADDNTAGPLTRAALRCYLGKQPAPPEAA